MADGADEDWEVVLVADGWALDLDVEVEFEFGVLVGTAAANIELNSGDVQLLFGFINVAPPFSLFNLI